MGSWRLASALLAALGVFFADGCAGTTTLAFRSPPGSRLQLQDGDGQQLASVAFPGKATVEQFSSPSSDDGRPLSGELQLNELVEAAAVPAQARHALVDDAGKGVFVRVRGTWQAFSYSPTALDKMATHYVDVERAALLRLLQGQPVVIEGKSPSGQPVFRLSLGLDGGGVP